MKTKNSIPTILVAILILSITFISACKKDSSLNNDQSSTVTEDKNANADLFQESEGISSDVDVISDQSMEMHGVDMRLHPSTDEYGILTCATVTNDTVNHVITIDFGTGCTGHNGHTRSGQIIIHYNGDNYFTPGFERTITLNNYYIDQKHVEGTRIITNNGFNGAGNLNWTINAQNMRITHQNGNFHVWNSLRNREMLGGDSTLTNSQDDVYSITGSASGFNSRGDSCIATISNPLIKEGSCNFRFVSGTVEITSTSRPALTLDYGNGTCDDLATITRNGVTYTIHIH